MYSHIKEVRIVSADNTHEMERMVREGWKPLNIAMQCKRRLWLKKTTFSILFGHTKSNSEGRGG